MFDFYYGTSEEINSDEEKYLLFVKRLLPRFCNSIPDSEYLALFHTIQKHFSDAKEITLVETGSGASTLVLLYCAIKMQGKLFTWDINSLKGSLLRTVAVETICRDLHVNIWDYWVFIQSSSVSKYTGLSILQELNKNVNLSFHDSEHTADILMKEVEIISSHATDNSIICIDDANYQYAHNNIAYINMVRKKVGLKPVEDEHDNIGLEFHQLVDNYLRMNWMNVQLLTDTYKENCLGDIFWSYFAIDRQVMAANSMEKTENLLHRFDSWKILERICKNEK